MKRHTCDGLPCGREQAVGALLPADSVGWVGAHLGTGQAEVHGTGDSSRPEIIEALSRVLHIHPMLVSFQARPEDLKPRRMSDLIPLRDWTSHPVYAELFVPSMPCTSWPLALAVEGRGVDGLGIQPQGP